MDAQLGQRNWPHTGCHARAELDAPVSRRAASGGDSDCRVSRCLEQDGSQGDLERKEEPGDDDVLAAVRLHVGSDCTKTNSAAEVRLFFMLTSKFDRSHK